MDFNNKSIFSALDQFLKNEDNLIVQWIVLLEGKSNIHRRYLARAISFIILAYFMFSNYVLDLVTHLLMYLYPSYRSYILLQNPNLTKERLIDLLKYSIFIGFFNTFYITLNCIFPLSSLPCLLLKLILTIECVLPQQSPLVDFTIKHIVTPLFQDFEENQNLQKMNKYLCKFFYNTQNTNYSG